MAGIWKNPYIERGDFLFAWYSCLTCVILRVPRIQNRCPDGIELYGMKKKTTFRFTTVYVIVLSVLLLLTNIILGAVLMHQSVTSVTALVRKSMLDIVRTAADIVDGERLGSLKAEDVGGPVFEEVKKELSAFQNNIDIEYIYAVREEGEGRFIFTVDADPVNPADFGEEVLITKALVSASQGIPMVDESPAQDEWGNFYSAYCPVKDSRGVIVGIIGVDFDSAWYEEQIRSHTVSIGVITLIAVLAGILIVSSLSRALSSRFATITKELSVLSDDIDQLSQEIKNAGNPGVREETMIPASDDEEKPVDEIEEIGVKVKQMHDVMRETLNYMQEKANTDGLTGVGNRTAFIETENRYNTRIEDKSVRFAVAVFDINDLKKINDTYGHLSGDRVILGAAEVLGKLFGRENVFRIGGDEFLAAVENMDEETLKEKLKALEQEVNSYNEAHTGEEGKLSISAGGSVYRPETDNSFHDLFVRADEAMYEVKEEYHRRTGSRR